MTHGMKITVGTIAGGVMSNVTAIGIRINPHVQLHVVIIKMLIRILPIFQSVSVMKNAVKGKSAML